MLGMCKAFSKRNSRAEVQTRDAEVVGDLVNHLAEPLVEIFTANHSPTRVRCLHVYVIYGPILSGSYIFDFFVRDRDKATRLSIGMFTIEMIIDFEPNLVQGT
ncbi:hypothetical protein VNO77_18710 [Canavalia gladiata]|uniref:Uncharacterized protein n=1 Tax=Canavalia gladiata TaxID=3824 RepID=A0AAN9LM10_CANGL